MIHIIVLGKYASLLRREDVGYLISNFVTDSLLMNCTAWVEMGVGVCSCVSCLPPPPPPPLSISTVKTFRLPSITSWLYHCKSLLVVAIEK